MRFGGRRTYPQERRFFCEYVDARFEELLLDEFRQHPARASVTESDWDVRGSVVGE